MTNLELILERIELDKHVQRLGVDCDQDKLHRLYKMPSIEELVRAALASRIPSPAPEGAAEPVAWHLVDPQGNYVATENTCIRAWARIDGYKPTVENLLAYEEAGWRVVSSSSGDWFDAASPQPPAASAVQGALPPLPEPWSVANTMKCDACGKPYKPQRLTGAVEYRGFSTSITPHACECGSTSFSGTIGYDSPSREYARAALAAGHSSQEREALAALIEEVDKPIPSGMTQAEAMAWCAAGNARMDILWANARAALADEPPSQEPSGLTVEALMLDLDGDDDALSDELGAIWEAAADASEKCMHPRLRGFSEWCGRTQAACKVLIERLPAFHAKALASQKGQQK